MGIRPWKRLMRQRVVGRGGSFSRRSGNLFWRGDDWAEIWFFVMKTQLPGIRVPGVGWGGWANVKHGFDCTCYIWVCEMGWWSNERGTVCMELRGRGGQDQIRPGKRSRASASVSLWRAFSEGGLWSDTWFWVIMLAVLWEMGGRVAKNACQKAVAEQKEEPAATVSQNRAGR